jgi:glycosyltransferase involved in cell wall biosynthesis
VTEDGVTLWPKKERTSSLRLIWAARWEYDKGPQQLQAILRQLNDRHVDFKLCLLGQSFRQQPIEFEQIKVEFNSHLVQFGYATSRQQYLIWLVGGDIILSTARHEFQGLAVQEAVQLGCTPVLPNRLVYPQMFGSDYVYDSSPQAHETEAIAAADLIQALALKRQQGHGMKACVDHLTWPKMKAKYQHLLNGLVTNGS